MILNAIDPIRDSRWEAFLERQPEASIFHSAGWVEALRRTYGYQPVAFTSSRAGEQLRDGIPFCRINHWVGGHRMVSLPFSDHCVPLAEDSHRLADIVSSLQDKLAAEGAKRMEIRVNASVIPQCCGWYEAATAFVLHKLDLTPSIDAIFDNLHKDCVQRKIHRAEREGLTREEGVSELLLSKFYRLLLMTRRRHGLPPQPITWFQNLLVCLKDKVTIRIASKDSRPVAGILTLQYKHGLVYKYGCSDEHFSSLGGIQMLLWKAIQDAKKNSLTEFDMGRSEIDNSGLVTFKERWNASRTNLAYLQYPRPNAQTIQGAAPSTISKRVFAYLPDGLRSATGRLLYKYMG